MQIINELERLVELARPTNRYSVSERDPGQFVLWDDRYMLDHLLALTRLRPVVGDAAQFDFEELLDSLSPGPTLTIDDLVMLDLLQALADRLDPKGADAEIMAAHDASLVICGTVKQVEHVIRAALDHRMQ